MKGLMFILFFALFSLAFIGMASAVWWNPVSWFGSDIKFSPSDNLVYSNMDEVNYDGVSTYTSISSGILSNGAGTIAARVYLRSLNEEPIIAKQINGLNSMGVLSVGYYSSVGGLASAGTPGKIYWHSRNGIANLESSSILEKDREYNIIVTFDGSGAKLYVDGVLEDSKAGMYSLGSYGYSGSETARIGSWAPDGRGFFDGKISKFRIYNTSLSASDISALNKEMSSAVIELSSNYCNDSDGINYFVQGRVYLSTKPNGIPDYCDANNSTILHEITCNKTTNQSREIKYPCSRGCVSGACFNECTNVTYTNWSVCYPSNVQIRNTIRTLPSGCKGGLVTQRPCNYSSSASLIFTLNDTYWLKMDGVMVSTGIKSFTLKGITPGVHSILLQNQVAKDLRVMNFLPMKVYNITYSFEGIEE